MSSPIKKIKLEGNLNINCIFSKEGEHSNFELITTKKIKNTMLSPLSKTNSSQTHSRINSIASTPSSYKQVDQEEFLDTPVKNFTRDQVCRTPFMNLLGQEPIEEVGAILPSQKICIKSSTIVSITGQTLASRIQLEHQNKETQHKLLIIDCRYKQEYDAGHIKDAIHLSEPNQLNELLNYTKSQNYIPLIRRSPQIFDYIRKQDRENNIYPKLDFPQVYVLEGGFSKFNSEFSEYSEGLYLSEKSGSLRKVEKNEWNQKWSTSKKENVLLRMRPRSQIDFSCF